MKVHFLDIRSVIWHHTFVVHEKFECLQFTGLGVLQIDDLLLLKGIMGYYKGVDFCCVLFDKLYITVKSLYI